MIRFIRFEIRDSKFEIRDKTDSRFEIGTRITADRSGLIRGLPLPILGLSFLTSKLEDCLACRQRQAKAQVLKLVEQRPN